MSARFILKLAECPCIFRLHEAGQHRMVTGYLCLYANGRITPQYRVPFCRRGQWLLEEVIETAAGWAQTVRISQLH